MILLSLLACANLVDPPRLGGGVRLDGALTEGTDGESHIDATVVISSVSQLADDLAPSDGSDPDEVGVNSFANGPWTTFVFDTADGPSGEAWFLAGAPELVVAGETLQINAQSGLGGASFAISGVDGQRRLWVGQASSINTNEDVAAGLDPGDGLTFAEGDEASSVNGRCVDTVHRDLIVRDAGSDFDLPFGGTVDIGGTVAVHGGHTEESNISSDFSCGESWGLSSTDEVTVALVSAESFSADALWP